MVGGPAEAGGSLTVEQQDELFLFRWLFGLSFKDIDERLPDWERVVLLDRAIEWLPRILQLDTTSTDAPRGETSALPLASLGIQETLLPAPG